MPMCVVKINPDAGEAGRELKIFPQGVQDRPIS